MTGFGKLMENRAEEILSASFHKSTVRFMVYPIIVYLSCRDLRDKCNNWESDHGGYFACLYVF